MNPALDEALEILQKFAVDVYNGKVSEDTLRFGAPWRHRPQIDHPKLRMEWAKVYVENNSSPTSTESNFTLEYISERQSLPLELHFNMVET